MRSDFISREAAIEVIEMYVAHRGSYGLAISAIRALPAATDAVEAAAPKGTPFDRFTKESWDAYDERGMDLTVAECTHPDPASGNAEGGA